MSSLPSVAWALFSIALFGGLMHCAFMCGPLVMSQLPARLNQIAPRSNDISELTRLKGALMMPYHLGRLTTYVFLGFLFGLFGQGMTMLWQQTGGVLILLSGLLILLSLGPQKNWIQGEKIKLPKKIQKKIQDLMSHPISWRGYILGLILGFIPCGMLYGALGAAAATASPVSGGIVMGAFALGTIPALVMVALIGSLASSAVKNKLKPLAKGGTAVAGIWLCYIGISSLI